VALSEYQRGICQLIAANRRANGESYVAGGVALNTLLNTPRLSRDIALFHDTDTALITSWLADRQLLQTAGYAVTVLLETAAFVEAVVSQHDESVLMQWARDSAFRFFPLVEDDLLGLVLHPFDLATNKVLALAGRLEARDWIDVLNCHEYIQPLGYLVWAACGKAPGFSPITSAPPWRTDTLLFIKGHSEGYCRRSRDPCMKLRGSGGSQREVRQGDTYTRVIDSPVVQQEPHCPHRAQDKCEA